MRKGFERQLKDSRYIHNPLPIDREEYAETAISAKSAVESIALDEFKALGDWSADELAHFELSGEHSSDGDYAIRFSCPTRLETWPESYARIYATPWLKKRISGENWTEYNRLTVSVYPSMQGFKHVTLNIQLVNEGASPVPDRYMREGYHQMNLKNHEWNEVSVEIANVCRDKITGIMFGYDIVGNEREATDTACFYIKGLRLEKVAEPEKFRGWEPEDGRIIFCGSGYQPGAVKTAIASKNCSEIFQLVDSDSGKVILRKEVERIRTRQGDFSILDFSSVEQEGNYLLVCGDIITRTFPIRWDVWEDSIWKTINLFFCERCGYEVPGIHKYCHGNVVCHHEDKSVIANGGWHDAADMSQNLTNTADAVYAFFHAAMEQRHNKELFERLIEEGKWGLDWMLRTRFENGYRNTGSGGSVWTSNLLGDCDQIDSQAQNLAIENFMAAAAEALAAQVLREIDREQSAYLEKIAAEDWGYAYEAIDKEQYVGTMDPARVSSPVLLYSMGALAASDLYLLTGDVYYEEKAEEIGERIIACQQTDYPSWDIPLTGFFYRDMEKSQIQHYNHRCYDHMPIMALRRMCNAFPDHSRWIHWYHSIVLYTEYLKKGVQATAPYHMAPASIYHVGEAEADKELFLNQQAFAHPGMLEEYKIQVENGVALGEGYYLKRFPVWFSYRGNNGLLLSGGSAAAFGADIRNDFELQKTAEEQLQWVTGRNPFNQSLMLGEGYNYADQYLCLPGEICGGVCVGIESFQNEDEPYWPQTVNAVYRELWIHPSIRFLLLSGHINRKAVIKGCFDICADDRLVIHNLNYSNHRTIELDKDTGAFRAELPSGEYRFCWNGMDKTMSVLAGQTYTLTDSFIQIDTRHTVIDNTIQIQIITKGKGSTALEFLTENAEMEASAHMELGQTKEFSAKIIDASKPYLITVVPDGCRQEKADIFPKHEIDLDKQ